MSHNYPTKSDIAATIEHFEERAAIHEFDAGIPRPNAESMALREVVEYHGQEAGKAVQQWRIHRKGATT